MKKLVAAHCAFALMLGMGTLTFTATDAVFTAQPACAAPPVDNDNDGYKDNKDCDDTDPNVNPGAVEICDNGIDDNCDGFIDSADPTCSGGTCVDGDGDGYFAYDAVSCPEGSDCNDSDPDVNPGAVDDTCDGIDQDCSGSDNCVSGGGHDGITGTFDTPADVTAKCLECHPGVGTDVVNSLHGMKLTPTPEVTNMSRDSQKLMEVNTFCTYPDPNQAGAACLGCHPTLGKFENMTAADIDCLRCHNDDYKRRFAAEPDSANWITVVDWEGTERTYIPSDRDANGEFYVEFDWNAMPGLTVTDLFAGVHKPTTKTCLSCHAKAGGGDWTKRGDIGLSTVDPSAAEDVHLASAANGGAGLTCSSCHIASTHTIPGRGIDLRPSEGGDAQACVDCHADMAAGGHEAKGNRAEPDRHVKRVACQSCHIPAFGKGGATELWRNWKAPHWNGALCNGQGAWVGEEHKVSNVVPDHVWFDGTSYVYDLADPLTKVDPISGFDSVADANGDANDPQGMSMLVPIKRHQSNMAVMADGPDAGKVIPFDVVYQFMTGLSDDAAENGKAFAGYTGNHEWRWLEAEMAINHGVSPATNVADCTNCHHARNEFDYTIETKLDKLGYKLKGDPAVICSQCHNEKSFKKDWEQMHAHTAKGSGIGCTFCHDIYRPERGLCEPCNPDGTENTACINEFVDTNYYDHCSQ